MPQLFVDRLMTSKTFRFWLFQFHPRWRDKIVYLAVRYRLLGFFELLILWKKICFKILFCLSKELKSSLERLLSFLFGQNTHIMVKAFSVEPTSLYLAAIQILSFRQRKMIISKSPISSAYNWKWAYMLQSYTHHSTTVRDVARNNVGWGVCHDRQPFKCSN